MERFSPSIFKSNPFNALCSVALILAVLGCVCSKDFGAEKNGGNVDKPGPSSSESNTKSKEESSDANKDKGDFVVQDTSVTNVRYEQLDRDIKKSGVLTKAAADLNEALILPRDIYLKSSDCGGQINAFYNPEENSITICYELMEHFANVFIRAGYSNDEAGAKTMDAVAWVFLHEVGHALIENYKLPVAGGEEDAADRLSSYVNLKELGDKGADAVIAGGEAFALMSKNRKPGAKEMADEHLLGEQRFFNSLCLLYGSDTVKWSQVVTKGFLPKDRAVRCPSEFQRNQESWDTLLEPWRKN